MCSRDVASAIISLLLSCLRPEPVTAAAEPAAPLDDEPADRCMADNGFLPLLPCAVFDDAGRAGVAVLGVGGMVCVSHTSN